MTEIELQQIEAMGAHYYATLTGLIDGMPVEAQVHMTRLVFNAVLVQMLNRIGPCATVDFLRRTIDRIDLDVRHRSILQ